uniref:Secreted protein n=1 Tax=Triticum urartu TaxID=4572 RepID=A0A8R7UI59_TRIUA
MIVSMMMKKMTSWKLMMTMIAMMMVQVNLMEEIRQCKLKRIYQAKLETMLRLSGMGAKSFWFDED